MVVLKVWIVLKLPKVPIVKMKPSISRAKDPKYQPPNLSIVNNVVGDAPEWRTIKEIPYDKHELRSKIK